MKPADLPVNLPLGKTMADPDKVLAEGWYDCGTRGRWYFRRRDSVVILDPWHNWPMLCHVHFITRSGWLMAENKFNGASYGAVPPGVDRVFPCDLMQPIGAKYADD